jgi:hypothetical protein
VLRQATRRSPVSFAAVSAVESLEVRRLLAAFVVDGVLYVDGTDAGEQITIRAPEPNPLFFDVTVGSERTTISSGASDGLIFALIRRFYLPRRIHGIS